MIYVVAGSAAELTESSSYSRRLRRGLSDSENEVKLGPSVSEHRGRACIELRPYTSNPLFPTATINHACIQLQSPVVFPVVSWLLHYAPPSESIAEESLRQNHRQAQGRNWEGERGLFAGGELRLSRGACAEDRAFASVDVVKRPIQPLAGENRCVR